MSGKKSARKHTAKASAKTPIKGESTATVDKGGKLHKTASTMTPAHGPNKADRADTAGEHATDTQPEGSDAVTRAAHNIPETRRVDEGQNTGGGLD